MRLFCRSLSFLMAALLFAAPLVSAQPKAFPDHVSASDA